MTCKLDIAGYVSLKTILGKMNTDSNAKITKLEISNYLSLQTPINIEYRSSGILHNDLLSADQDTTIDYDDIWEEWTSSESSYFVII